jgi:hypothetical protein
MTGSSAGRERRRRSTAVPGQFLGYSLQELRFVSHLFAAGDDDFVSLEVIGDTGVHRPGGKVTSEELKSRTSRANPVADNAEDLWKTFRNWVEAVARGDLDAARTRFRLRVTRTFSGEIVKRFSAARDEKEAEQALEFARGRVWRAADGTSLLPSLPERVREHVEVIFTADASSVAQVVAAFEVEYGSGYAWADLRRAAAPAAIDPDVLDDVLQDAVGWVKRKITECIEQSRPAVVSVREFRSRLRAVQRRLDNQLILVSAAPGPDALAIRRHLRTVQTFVQQLELIDATDDDKLEAVTQYLRASNDRVIWAKRGWVHQASFDDFEAELVETWRRKQRVTDLDHGARPPSERGMRLYLACCDHSSRLDGREPPPGFCRGSFHLLADHMTIGWHPDYSNLLQAKGAQRDALTGGDNPNAEHALGDRPDEAGRPSKPTGAS